jgi:phage tail sheath gpL-like
MPVSFDHIPANIRVPLFYAEINNTLAGVQQMDQPALLIGPMTSTDPNAAPLDKPVLVLSTSQAYLQFGAGSVLADMVATYRINDPYGEIWAIPVGDGTGAAAAAGEIAVAGTASQSGTIPLYIAGDLVNIGVAAGATAAEVAATIAAGISALPFTLVKATYTADATTVQLTALQSGELGNQIDIGVAYLGLAAGQVVPAGITLTVTPMSGGAGLPDLENAIAAMGDDVYDYIGLAWSDTTVLDQMQLAMDDFTGRWAWNRQVYGHAFAARTDAAADLVTFGRTRNDQHMSVLGFATSPSPPWRRAAALTAQAATALRNDPARPLQTLPLLGVMAPQRQDKFNLSTNNTLLYSGFATEDEVSGQVTISRCATTYQKNAWGQPDPSYLDVTTLATIQYFVRFMRTRILQKFPRSKLADDGTAFGPGQAIVTPRIIKAELVAAYSELVSTGIVENIESFKSMLIVERDANDPNRVNVMASPDLVNQLRILAMLVAFRLQTAPVPAATAA